MSLTINLNNNRAELVGALTHQQVANAWPDFATVAQRSKDALTLDLSGVDNIDTAGLAWLIHLVGVARASNVALYFSAIPERLTSLAKISNVEDLLQVQ